MNQSFFGASVSIKEPFHYTNNTNEEFQEILHITHVNFSSLKNDSKRHIVYCSVSEESDSKFAIATLMEDSLVSFSLDLQFSEDATFTVEGGQSQIHLTGFIEMLPNEDNDMIGDFDSLEDEEDEDDSEAELVKRNTALNEKKSVPVAKKQKISKVAGTNKFGKIIADNFFNQSYESESDENDSDFDENKFEECDDDEEDQNNTKETLTESKKNEQVNEKTNKPISKSEKKNSAKASSNIENETSNSSVDLTTCKECNKKFKNASGLEQHKKAKH